MTKTKTTKTTAAKKAKKSVHRVMDVLVYIAKNEGCTPKDVLHHVYRDVVSRNYGRQSPAGYAIAQLRAKGLLVDDCSRCPVCLRASRGRRNVELETTLAGRQLVATF